jgi:hypothetical protein
VDYITIAIANNGTPYVAYRDWYHEGYGATAMKYNGSNWITVGDTDFSGCVVIYTSIAIDGSGTPYVAFENADDSSKVTVMKYGFPNQVKSITQSVTSLTIFPDPNDGSFTLQITSPGPSKGEVNVTITNILGEKVKELTACTNTDTNIQLDAPAGMYFITAFTEQGRMSAKVVVIR